MAAFVFIAVVLNLVTASDRILPEGVLQFESESQALVDTDFYDHNPLSFKGRLFDLNNKDSFDDIVKVESNADYIIGFAYGIRPFNSPEVYRSIVHSIYFGFNANLTGTIKFELFDFARF